MEIKKVGRLPNDGREYKKCLECNEEFPISAFPQSSSKGYKFYRSRCRPCYNVYCLRTPKRDCQKDYGETRLCKDCNEIKSLEDFYSSGRGYLRPECKPCFNTKKTEEKKSQREKYNALDRAAKNAIRMQAIEAYGGKCICCEEMEELFLTFDHVYNDGQAHRKAVGSGVRLYRWLRNNNYPDTIQLLCWNCNWAKSHGGCPHQKKKYVMGAENSRIYNCGPWGEETK